MYKYMWLVPNLVQPELFIFSERDTERERYIEEDTEKETQKKRHAAKWRQAARDIERET